MVSHMTTERRFVRVSDGHIDGTELVHAHGTLTYNEGGGAVYSFSFDTRQDGREDVDERLSGLPPHVAMDFSLFMEAYTGMTGLRSRRGWADERFPMDLIGP